METHSDMTAKSQGQKISIPGNDAISQLEKPFLVSGMTNREVFEVWSGGKATPKFASVTKKVVAGCAINEDDLSRLLDTTPQTLRYEMGRCLIANRIIQNREKPREAEFVEKFDGSDHATIYTLSAPEKEFGGKSCGEIIEVYRRSYSLEQTNRITNVPFPALRKAIKIACKLQGKIVIEGTDWNMGKKKKAPKFNLFEFIKSAHNHFSIKVFCESHNLSPRYVLDLCFQANEAGYPVIAPKISGRDLEWLSYYDPHIGDSSYGNANDEKLPKPRGGKEIFKRLGHSENPNRRQCNLPAKTTKGKKRLSSGGKRGLVNKRGGKTKSYDNPWKGLSAEMREGLMKHLQG